MVTPYSAVSRERAMRAVLVLLGLLAVAISQPNYQVKEKWMQWKAQHGKSYSSELEELERHFIWLSNMEYVQRHNEYADVFGFTLAMNHFGDMVSIIMHYDYINILLHSSIYYIINTCPDATV